MTRLSVIRKNHLALECPCGHWRLVAVSELISRLGGHISTSEVAACSKCTVCGRLGVGFQITYVGSSETAMSGARQRLPDHDKA